MKREQPLEVIHTYVWGSAEIASMHGRMYYVSFIDDHTQKVWVYFMQNKSEVFGHFKEFKAMAEKEIGMQIKTLRSDGGVEYFSMSFWIFCKSMVYAGNLHVGILHSKMELPKGKKGTL